MQYVSISDALKGKIAVGQNVTVIAGHSGHDDSARPLARGRIDTNHDALATPCLFHAQHFDLLAPPQCTFHILDDLAVSGFISEI
jgi:hypothetical protein